MNGRILIVDDDASLSELLAEGLGQHGFVCSWVTSSPQALERVGREEFDVVISDINLPRMTGIELCQRIAENRPDLPVVVITAFGSLDTAVAAMRAGASDYLLKDRLARLGPAVEHALKDAAERRARREAEDRLGRLYHAVEQSPAIIMITDLEGRIEYANPRFTAVSGYRLEEVQGQNPRFLKSGQMKPAEYSRIWKIIASGGQWRGEFANRAKDGRVYWEEAAISPVRDAEGRITHYVKVGEDITERKRWEETQRKLESQLRQAQKMEALGELAGGIAHDFNNFLGAIIMNAQLAKTAPTADATVAKYLDSAIAASRQAAGVARQMLNFSRPDEQPRRPQQLGPVVQESVRLLQATRPAHVEVEVEIPSAGRMVLANAPQVQEAVINLWTNACDACHASGGRIVVSVEDADREADASGQWPGLRAGPCVRVTVRDNGCGMTPEVQERIFEPFFSTKPEGQNLGLGLPVVRSIMLAHQGAVLVESRPQEGTAVHLLFPEHVAEAAAPGRPESLPCGSGQRIMLVDDHALYRDATRSLLQSLGYRVEAFGSPLEAIAAFRARDDEFDLVLTDLSMREMNGVELARQVLAARPAIPIILSSGYELAGVAATVRDLGVRELLTKPVQRGQLAQSLARALAQREVTG